jgi:hypothetical protein
MKRLNASIWLQRLSAVQFTLSCILMAMALVAAGTLAQVQLGTTEAQRKFFDSWWITTPIAGRDVPVFPGGLTVGILWLLNLTAAFMTQFRPVRKDIGLFISHTGLILLLGGQCASQLLSQESQMLLREGESRNYSENARAYELVFMDTSNPGFDEVTSIPERQLERRSDIHSRRLPFSIHVLNYFRNAQLNMAMAGEMPSATRGVGTRIQALERPPVTVDDETNNTTALFEVRQGTHSLGTWLASAGLGAPQSVQLHGKTYHIQMRARRIYYPFTLTLEEFRHDRYQGTSIPKNFSSKLRLTHPEKNENRDVLIYMNHPLRYEGKTFYQASFGEGDTLSVLQVMDNPAAWTPYVSSVMIALGLLIQFLSHALGFLRKRT